MFNFGLGGDGLPHSLTGEIQTVDAGLVMSFLPACGLEWFTIITMCKLKGSIISSVISP